MSSNNTDTNTSQQPPPVVSSSPSIASPSLEPSTQAPPAPAPSSSTPTTAPTAPAPTTVRPEPSTQAPAPEPSTSPSAAGPVVTVSSEQPATTVKTTLTAAPSSAINKPSSGTGNAVSSPSASPSNDVGAGKSTTGSSSGLNGTAKVAVAVVVPVVAVALICVLLLLLYRRRKNKQAAEEARKKEVEDYSFNPNTSMGPNPGAIIAGDQEPYDMEETSTNGYRGWGTTTGARSKLNGGSSTGAPTSTGPISPVHQAGYPATSNAGGEPMYSAHGGLVKEIGGANVPIHGQGPNSDGGFSTAPLVSGAEASNSQQQQYPQQQPVGVERGLSNASSNYSALTHGSQESDGMGHPGYYDGPAGGYAMDDIGTAYSSHPTQHYQAYNPQMGSYGNQAGAGDPGYGAAFGGAGFGSIGTASPPVIRDVSARRNTKIETPTSEHFPQQGSGGIAQNF